jgi:hypothetical protein
VDSLPVAGLTLARGLKETLGYEVIRASSTAEALRCLRTEQDRIGVIILALETGPDAGLSFVRNVKDYCEAAAIRIPRFLNLSPGPLGSNYERNAAHENKFRIAGAECLLLGFEQQVHATVRRMMFESVCEKGTPTIIVDRCGPGTRFFVLGPARAELIPCGPRLVPIFNCMAIHYGTEISTRTLAEVADITDRYVRVYMHRLKSRYDQARKKVGVEILGKEVFRTFRRDGAHVHMLNARVKFR